MSMEYIRAFAETSRYSIFIIFRVLVISAYA